MLVSALDKDDEKFIDLHDLVMYIETARRIMAVNAVLFWAKILKYGGNWPWAARLLASLRIAFWFLIGSVLVTAIVWVGFAFVFNVGLDLDAGFEDLSTSSAWIASTFIGEGTSRLLLIIRGTGSTPPGEVYGVIVVFLFVIFIPITCSLLFFAVVASAVEQTHNAEQREKARALAEAVLSKQAREKSELQLFVEKWVLRVAFDPLVVLYRIAPGFATRIARTLRVRSPLERIRAREDVKSSKYRANRLAEKKLQQQQDDISREESFDQKSTTGTIMDQQRPGAGESSPSAKPISARRNSDPEANPRQSVSSSRLRKSSKR